MRRVRQTRNRIYERRGLLRVGAHSEAFPRLRTYGGPTAGVAIGRYVFMGHGCEVLLGGEHRTDWVTTAPLHQIFRAGPLPEATHLRTRGPVEIGSDVWVGAHVTIMSGVRIAEGAVVGARSLVASDVPPYTVVAGVPARVVRQRFTTRQVEALLRIRWWEWPDARVQMEAPLLMSGAVDDFIARHDPALSQAASI